MPLNSFLCNFTKFDKCTLVQIDDGDLIGLYISLNDLGYDVDMQASRWAITVIKYKRKLHTA